MKRWDFTTMMNAGSKLFASIHKRYQDDIIILCQTKRQLERAKQRLMDILHERRLRLSRKKTCIGSIDKGFHSLGINYLEPQPLDGTNVTQVSNDSATHFAHCFTSMREGENSSLAVEQADSAQPRIVPHARTLRNAREQVKQMVNDGFSTRRIKRYLSRG
jgi:hypothetical protein